MSTRMDTCRDMCIDTNVDEAVRLVCWNVEVRPALAIMAEYVVNFAGSDWYVLIRSWYTRGTSKAFTE